MTTYRRFDTVANEWIEIDSPVEKVIRTFQAEKAQKELKEYNAIIHAFDFITEGNE